MSETRKQFLARMKEDNTEFKKLFKNHRCLTCANLDYYDWYFCDENLHNDETGRFISMEPLRNCDCYKKRNFDGFWGLIPEDLDKFYPKEKRW